MVTPANKPSCHRDDAIQVLKQLRAAGHEAYFAGGCVRDQLLGLKSDDYDIATNALPKRVRELFRQTQAVGAAFGVILVRQNQSTVEVATFRAESNYDDGRRPSQVHFTTAKEDAQRRDFTINGLFFDPLENQVIDFVDGRRDLQNRILRAIGNPDERFAEDHLRLLRAVRFAARFGFTIEEQTELAIRRHVPSLIRISPERIADELRRMLASPTRAVAWPMLCDFQLLQIIFRTMDIKGTVPFSAARCPLMQIKGTVPFSLALAAGILSYRMQAAPDLPLVELLNKSHVRATIRALRQSLRLSNDELDDVEGCLMGLGILLAESMPTLAQKKRFMARPTAQFTRQMLPALVGIGQHVQRIVTLLPELEQLSQTEFAPAPFITGDDLVAMGFSPGPVFKNILETIYDHQLEGKLADKSAAMDMAKQLGGKSK